MTTMYALRMVGEEGKNMGWCPVRQKGINGRLQARSPPTTGADTPRDFLVVAVSFLRVRPCPAQVCFGVAFVLGK